MFFNKGYYIAGFKPFVHTLRRCSLFIFIFFLFSCTNSKPLQTAKSDTELLTENIPRYNLTLLAASDNLFHITIINTHKQGDIYDFSPIYFEIKDLAENADLAFINQETVMAGEAFGYSGYPLFNTPQSLAAALTDTGFDIINIANNHTMDMGEKGLIATLDFLETVPEITVIGARKAGESKRIITKNNITLGFLSYTYGLNGHTLPKNNQNLVSIINKDKMAEEIAALRPLCDFLIVSMHWGDEYLLIEPAESQIELAGFLAEQNVDLIIGHHPHVLQRVEILPRPDNKETLCFYSLGNFVSNQIRKERVLGGVMLATFTKEGGNLYISDSGMIPVVCHFEQSYKNTKVYPLYSYTEELLAKHLLKSRDKSMDFDFFNSILNQLGTKLIMKNPFLKAE